MALALSRDDLVATLIPIAVYWICSGIYMIFEGFNDYRMHTKVEEEAKNFVSKKTVMKTMLLLHFNQICISLLLFKITNKKGGYDRARPPQPPLHVIILQVFVAMVVMDTWQYFTHRMMHEISFLYKHIHSKHHELVHCFALGAMYCHPIEGLITDTGGAVFAFLISGMTPLTSIFFFSFATIKTIDDHSCLWVPGNILHIFFKHNTAYHDLHHQPYGLKYNFSNPFFVTWDKLLGTSMPYKLEERKNGQGIKVRPA